MKKCRSLVWVCCVFIGLCVPALADDMDPADLPWKKNYLNVGYYWAFLNSSFRLGETNLGVGLDIDVEDFLDLDNSKGSFRIDLARRVSKNMRHKIELGWFSFNRSGTSYISETITLPPELGGGTIGPGQTESTFNFDIIKAKYEYSFLLDDRVDLNVGAGLFIMPFEIGLFVGAGGVGSQEVTESITAPLPVFGIGFDIALAPKWFLRQQNDLFYLEIDSYKGGIADIQLAVEYLPWKYIGFGLGIDFLTISVEADGDTSVPGVDFNGKIEFNTTGIQLYLKGFI